MRILFLIVCLYIMLPSGWSQDESDDRQFVPQFAEKGRFGGAFSLGVLSGNGGNLYHAVPGTVSHFDFKYNFADFQSAGIGIGSQLPAITSNLIHMPLYLQYQYWTLQKPYFKIGLNTGYSFAFIDLEENVYEAKGGLMVNPFIGLKLNKSNDWAWSINLGLLYQDLYYQFGDIDINGVQVEQEWELWRFMLKTTFEI